MDPTFIRGEDPAGTITGKKDAGQGTPRRRGSDKWDKHAQDALLFGDNAFLVLFRALDLERLGQNFHKFDVQARGSHGYGRLGWYATCKSLVNGELARSQKHLPRNTSLAAVESINDGKMLLEGGVVVTIHQLGQV